MTDSDLRRQVLIAAAYGFAAAACICITAAEWSRSGASTMAIATAVLSALLVLAFLAMSVRCARIRSRVGKSEISFISIRDGEPKKSPPVRGKRPPVR